MKNDPHAYNIVVRRDTFDGETLFEARVKELPDVVEFAESFQDAYDLAVDTIETAAAAYAEQGRVFPPPTRPADEFSGRVTLRIPRSLHRALAVVAEEEGTSLNAHLVNVLTYYCGFATGAKASMPSLWQGVPTSKPKPQGRRSHLSVVRNTPLAAAN